MCNKTVKKKFISDSSPDTQNYRTNQIPTEKITVGKFCRRSNYSEGLDDLKESIRKSGLIHLPTVLESDKGTFTLICGHRRLLACEALGWDTIHCHIVKDGSDEIAAILAYDENYMRVNMHPVDQAKSLKYMKNLFGITDEAIGKIVKLPQSGVTERLRILELPDAILAKIDPRPESSFKLTHAVALAQLAVTSRINHMIEVQELANKTIANRLSTTELKLLVKFFTSGKYDQLPDKLRIEILKNKNMSASMANLYIEPSGIIGGDDEISVQKKKMLQNLDKNLLENHLLKALKQEWSYEKTKNKLLKIIDNLTKPNNNKNDQNDSTIGALVQDIWQLGQKIAICENDITKLATSNPKKLTILNEMAELLSAKLNIILKRVDKSEIERSDISGSNLL